MEHLIVNLKEKLLLRKEQELQMVKKYNDEKFNEIIFISSGKIFELEWLISFLDDILNYYQQTKKITK